MELEPKLNPFVTPLERTGQLEKPPLLQDRAPSEGQSMEDDQGVGEATAPVN